MTAAVKLYVAKSDGEERTFRPLLGAGDEDITATEVLSAVAELLRAMRLGPMELGLWYRAPPGRMTAAQAAPDERLSISGPRMLEMQPK